MLSLNMSIETHCVRTDQPQPVSPSSTTLNYHVKQTTGVYHHAAFHLNPQRMKTHASTISCRCPGHTDSPQRCSEFIPRGFCPFTKPPCQHGSNLNRTMEAAHNRLMLTSPDRQEKCPKGYLQCCLIISTESIKVNLRESLLTQDGNYSPTGPRADADNLLWTQKAEIPTEAKLLLKVFPYWTLQVAQPVIQG